MIFSLLKSLVQKKRLLKHRSLSGLSTPFGLLRFPYCCARLKVLISHMLILSALLLCNLKKQVLADRCNSPVHPQAVHLVKGLLAFGTMHFTSFIIHYRLFFERVLISGYFYFYYPTFLAGPK